MRGVFLCSFPITAGFPLQDPAAIMAVFDVSHPFRVELQHFYQIPSVNIP
jgi:hypothetical protein